MLFIKIWGNILYKRYSLCYERHFWIEILNPQDMIGNCKENLQEIKTLIASVKEEQYQYKSQLLSDATIGQHVRHILEFYLYQCL